MAYLEIADLRIEYEKNKPTLDQFDLAVEDGDLVSLLGPSGCGKTTTLRSVAGFIEPAAGQIVIDGKDNTRLPPNKRDIGLVFQSYALFPHLTVAQNVAFGLRMRKVPKKEIEERVSDALKLVDLSMFASRRPGQLSGGQRQRVALARAVVIEPKLLLLDEPLSNLDAKLRVSMRTEIRRLQQRLGITTMYVTHDQIEALAISDRVVVMNNGVIEQDGTPEEIYSAPATAFVADFMGFTNRFQARIAERQGDGIVLAVAEQQLTVQPRHPLNRHGVGDEVSVFFRSEGAGLSPQSLPNSIPGEIVFRTFQGQEVEYTVETDLGTFFIKESAETTRYDNGAIYIVLQPEKLVVLASEKQEFA